MYICRIRARNRCRSERRVRARGGAFDNYQCDRKVARYRELILRYYISRGSPDVFVFSIDLQCINGPFADNKTKI